MLLILSHAQFLEVFFSSWKTVEDGQHMILL